MKKRVNNRGQIMSIPFSMIFSIILIIFFIVVAIIAINYFLNIQRCSQVGLFVKYLQDDVNSIWGSGAGNTSFSFKEHTLPSAVKYVCFANVSRGAQVTGNNTIYNDISKNGQGMNFFFYPRTKACDTPSVLIAHVNLTGLKNPYCIAVSDKSEIKITKGFTESLVKVR